MADGATWKRAVTAASRRLLVLGGLVIAGWLLGGAAQAQADAPPSSLPAAERLAPVTDTAERRAGELLPPHPPAPLQTPSMRPSAQPTVNSGATGSGISWVRERPAERPEAAPRTPRVHRADSGPPPTVRFYQPPAQAVPPTQPTGLLNAAPLDTAPLDSLPLGAVPLGAVPLGDRAAETPPPGQFLPGAPLSGEPHTAAPARPAQPPVPQAPVPAVRNAADAPTFSPD
ncbi:hypothetical protein [Actinomadura sp. 21ATH]|uniref:hypothetical protein n=1 Tax=Actinomadura sp. 21ATH TaxID=1735444 RepID=UPI0035BEF1BE